MSGSRDKPHVTEEPTAVGDLRVVSRVHQGRRPAVLEQIGGPGAPRQFSLQLGETIIGRSLQAHISVESSLISRQHMVVRQAGPQLACEDLNSANGVYLNGVKAHSAVLHEGDTLQIGDVVFVFHEGAG